MKLSCTQKFPMSTLVGASLSLWTYHHVSGLRARCDLHQLEFNHVTFLQGWASLSGYCSAMDKGVLTVTASDKAMCPASVKPFHSSNHLGPSHRAFL